VNTVFAYNLSMACNHCVHPKCVGVCPTDAYIIRDDGIVYIDESKCMGCGYCFWACPYAAPRYNPDAGGMSKCNFCYDNIDMGLPPACVAACPMRVLDIGEVNNEKSLKHNEISLWESLPDKHPFPLPAYSHTEPHLAIDPHSGMVRANEGRINNQEEVKPKETKNEISLVVFSLSIQMAAGLTLLLALTGSRFSYMPELLIIGLLLIIGTLNSFLHLGKPINAWRAMNHLKKSWLSREIFMVGILGASWLYATFSAWYKVTTPAFWFMGLSGIGLVYCMARVYRLHSIPAWDTWRTNVGFGVTALLLGSAASMLIREWREQPIDVWGWYLIVLFSVQILLQLSDRYPIHIGASRLRLFLTLGGLIVSLVAQLFSAPFGIWIVLAIFILAMGEEIIGRRLFYEHLSRRLL